MEYTWKLHLKGTNATVKTKMGVAYIEVNLLYKTGVEEYNQYLS